MEFGTEWRNPSAHMRWPSCKRRRDGSVHVPGPFVFGMQVFGTDERTFPFLAKYPDLSSECGNLARILITSCGYFERDPWLQTLRVFDEKELGEAASSNGVGCEDTSGGGMSGNCRDTVGGEMEYDDWDDIWQDWR